MKKQIIIVLLPALLLAAKKPWAQAVNWAAMDQGSRQMISLYAGAEHGFIAGAGYSYLLKAGPLSIMPRADLSVPFGNNMTGDFKTKLGAQLRWNLTGPFQFSVLLQGVFRSYRNDFAHLLNFGSDLSGVAGYYRSHWFVAGEIGFDKAIVTRFRHTKAYKNQYPDVKDGWYEPPTGGNFYAGGQAGISLGRNDITAKAGYIRVQDFQTKPLLPFYGQICYSIRF